MSKYHNAPILRYPNPYRKHWIAAWLLLLFVAALALQSWHGKAVAAMHSLHAEAIKAQAEKSFDAGVAAERMSLSHPVYLQCNEYKLEGKRDAP